MVGLACSAGHRNTGNPRLLGRAVLENASTAGLAGARVEVLRLGVNSTGTTACSRLERVPARPPSHRAMFPRSLFRSTEPTGTTFAAIALGCPADSRVTVWVMRTRNTAATGTGPPAGREFRYAPSTHPTVPSPDQSSPLSSIKHRAQLAPGADYGASEPRFCSCWRWRPPPAGRLRRSRPPAMRR